MMAVQTNVIRRRIQLVESGRAEAEVDNMTDEEVQQTMEARTGLNIDLRLHDAALLIKKCFTIDPKERPSARELLALDFFRQVPIEDAEGQPEEMQKGFLTVQIEASYSES
ncbi:hypothetical protein BDZ89DRAFT_657147 [Hymenopellis radicata]|nr:hypothetical protein BDZ89DRAFT_657147 [Hymenopellis radicata]